MSEKAKYSERIVIESDYGKISVYLDGNLIYKNTAFDSEEARTIAFIEGFCETLIECLDAADCLKGVK